ncbi:MAG TPA: glycine--tRNA ligase subunit beta [Acidobacteriaceae bacterium]|nr:glycine--tRNA ligase subunit beta [Acidobacteriaceae bacterium]
MADFLFEIGMEEVPARMIAGAEAELARRTVALLGREGLLEEGVTLESEKVKTYSTPRRLAVWVRGVKAQQADVTEETTGPAVKIAFKEGKPTAAAEAFAKKSGVSVAELKTIMTARGEYLAASVTKKGRSAREVIASELPKEIAAIYWAKSMYWRAGKPERFVRPVHWMVCLLDDEVVPVEFAGKTAGRKTYGHRVLFGAEAMEVRSPATYAEQLKSAFVVADVEERRQRIRKDLDKATRAVSGARWREDEALVDTVTHLTEWPAVLRGGFGAEFLELPEEVLVTVMRDHQKYFAVEDAQGKLAGHFLAVLNIELTTQNEPVIRQGNERVLRARFNDARFFWEFDQRVPLRERLRLLEKVTFQKELGSYAAKTERVHALAKKLTAMVAARGATVDAEAVEGAALLAKTDLTTELVKEFTELQGVIGGLYARAQGLRAAVAEAIYDQYLPASATDALPRSLEGALLGLADRVDTLTGMFGLGMEPTGSKDPFALRRAATAVVRLLAETELPLELSEVLEAAGPSHELLARLRVFFAERVDFYLREVRGQAYDVAKAAMVSGYEDLRDLVARAEAVSAIRSGEQAATFAAVAAAFKRMRNILEQAADRDEVFAESVDARLLTDEAEKALAATGAKAAAQVAELAARREYLPALTVIAGLRPVVDEFFERVMVMAPEPEVRANRLTLLARTVKDFSRIADFSEIVVAG